MLFCILRFCEAGHFEKGLQNENKINDENLFEKLILL